MQIVTGMSKNRKVYDLPSAQDIRQNWPPSEYQKLHKAVCDLFDIPVPAGFVAHPKSVYM